MVKPGRQSYPLCGSMCLVHSTWPLMKTLLCPSSFDGFIFSFSQVILWKSISTHLTVSLPLLLLPFYSGLKVPSLLPTSFPFPPTMCLPSSSIPPPPRHPPTLHPSNLPPLPPSLILPESFPLLHLCGVCKCTVWLLKL